MTLAEFKAWFEGFTETLEGAPSEKQWERIKARVAEINGTVTTYPVYVDRYMPPYRPWYVGTPLNPIIYGANTSAIAGVAMNSAEAGENVKLSFGAVAPDFDSVNAMTSLGKAEYRSLNS
ncbi:hypothetical protein RHSP_31883 [Rhizobium freirei PRF 81]|uniref:Uncharacterized protein n=1 Tax=Rhizobium freirei PRF 81 TaxID=363754 RepID=N6U080_9HYPH|nr:hypothetical protein [Rhizobium freirei]ENN86054.1 hypothetical protein RHSP_31883 [Rhizobium freirei PRF 81]